MNVQKLTQKSIEAVQAAHSLAVEHSNAEVRQEHLLAALLEQQDGLIGSLLSRQGIDVKALETACREAVNRLPGVSGSAAENVYLSRELDAALTAAEKRAEKMGDAYVSVEHLFLGLLEKPSGELKRLFQAHGVTEKAFLEQLKQVRGNTHVQSDNPESTYDVLKKYGQDLVELARSQKLDPVIGRDGRDPERHPHPLAQDEEQPVPHRRAGRGQDGHRRGPGAAHRARRRARQPEGPAALRAGHGRAGGGREVPRRV